MPETCTCGTEIVPGALFCHKCGRPLRETAPEADPAPLPPAPSEAFRKPDRLPDEYLSPHFQNPIAVRAAWTAAFLAVILNLFLVWGFAVWLVSAGFLAAWLFMRRADTPLSVRGGARIGWITGILSFMIETVVLTLNTAFLATRDGGITGFFREQLSPAAATDPNMAEALKMLESTPGLVTLFAMTLLFLFAIITVLCIAGGAIGAKVLARD